jgi:hypothetical protein
VAIATASHDDAGAIQLLGVSRRFEHNRHFRPGQDGVIAAELDAILPDPKGSRGKGQPGGVALNCYSLKKIRIINSARAHKFRVTIASNFGRSMRASKNSERNFASPGSFPTLSGAVKITIR